EAKRALFEYIEAWYNRRRRHSALGYVSPEEYERNASTRSAAAEPVNVSETASS
ncbi:IS3 family transposase, partial [Corallococcus interemptor]|uniref:IS3 family transposase n=1 Tax=Corallococcus interemptor TaxID=2316720 RepID=UPI001FC909D5